jgi:hypothetical protein
MASMSTGMSAACALLALLASSTARVASAQDPGTGFEAGLRVGNAFALGRIVGGDDEGGDLDRTVEGAVPIWIDLGYRVLPELFVGLYGQYAFGRIGDNFGQRCEVDPDAECPASMVRLGLQVHHHLAPESGTNPWLGLGLGYEWLTFGIEQSDRGLSITTHGFELLNLQAGLDFEVTDDFHLGPALSFSIGEYSGISAECSGVAIDCMEQPEIEETGVHHWLMLAVRGAYAP